jgi:UDPglucose 6-dehydrogenase
MGDKDKVRIFGISLLVAIILALTEWDVFRGADLAEVKAAMKGTKLFDGRNVYEPREVREKGLTYHGIGVN